MGVKKTRKADRLKSVLFGVVEHYLKSGKPVGSQTLQEAEFDDLSSATIRNYFVQLEEEGYLEQLHTSGGRVPLPKAFRAYAHACLHDATLTSNEKPKKTSPLLQEGQEIIRYLEGIADTLSKEINAPIFLTMPHFDRDAIVEIKYFPVDATRLLAVMLTHFGTVHTEILALPTVSFSSEQLQRFEAFARVCLVRVKSGEQQHLQDMSKAELQIAQQLYQEVMARFLVSYSGGSQEDIYRTGYSKLLQYPEAKEPQAISSCLTLFENCSILRTLARDAVRADELKFWIGDELKGYVHQPDAYSVELNCSLIAAPYRIGHQAVGAFGIVGSMRVFYRELFDHLLDLTRRVSSDLTSKLCTFQISCREPISGGYSRGYGVGTSNPGMLRHSLRWEPDS